MECDMWTWSVAVLFYTGAHDSRRSHWIWWMPRFPCSGSAFMWYYTTKLWELWGFPNCLSTWWFRMEWLPSCGVPLLSSNNQFHDRGFLIHAVCTYHSNRLVTPTVGCRTSISRLDIGNNVIGLCCTWGQTDALQLKSVANEFILLRGIEMSDYNIMQFSIIYRER